LIAEQKLPANGMKHFTGGMKRLADEIKHPKHRHTHLEAGMKLSGCKHLHSGAQQKLF